MEGETVGLNEESICLVCFRIIRATNLESPLESREFDHEKTCKGFIKFGEWPSRAFTLDKGTTASTTEVVRPTEK